jgi:hypothetical protein
MKKYLLVIIVLPFITMACAKKMSSDSIPSIVANSMKSSFPNATTVDWDKEGTNYEAEFDINKIENEAQFDSAGKLLMHKEEIEITSLPGVITTAIAGKYKDHVIQDPEKVTKDGQVFYQMELDGKGKDLKIVLREDGSEQASMAYWD